MDDINSIQRLTGTGPIRRSYKNNLAGFFFLDCVVSKGEVAVSDPSNGFFSRTSKKRLESLR